MNQREALRETVLLGQVAGMPELPGNDVGLAHLRRMVSTAEAGDFDAAKLGRWLGWAQCALVAANVGITLADMKSLNMKWAGTEPEPGPARALATVPAVDGSEASGGGSIKVQGVIDTDELHWWAKRHSALGHKSAAGALAGAAEHYEGLEGKQASTAEPPAPDYPRAGDAGELRCWAQWHADRGPAGVAHVLYEAAQTATPR
ncbi:MULTISPECIES: hypothetical protein [Mycolicibacter]|uniref:DUF222 domain-containing protein n=2 Tax=Mycolicibacter TaxID=1073531 RepID=A0ABU5XL52_9MYCO|nr:MULTISPECIES: hypothetical protein [unclassified Mycolicibacter]MEB3023018.1 hypothetical protein [Mycolicibacter sp. MYC098]MEB3033528.1 hypothetical protein [Mycolicibacter sp. MYC340]